MSTARYSDTNRTGGAPAGIAAAKSERRRTAAQQRAAAARRATRRRRTLRWGGLAAVVLVAAAGIGYAATHGSDGREPSASPVVGGDLHSVAVIDDRVFVGGHEAVAVSRDGGRRWQRVASLDGADAMGWAITADAVLVGGHPGLYRSTDRGTTFTKVSDAAVEDVHALGAASATVYLASPQTGLMASTDGGRSWQVRSGQAGRSFMGAILVDPTDPARLVAPDMSAGLVVSSDGGRTFTPMGGPSAAMAATWNPRDIKQIIAVGRRNAARSADGGATWQPIQVPSGVTAASFDSTGTTVYAAALDGERARLYRSGDGGITWTPTT